ncbi:MAG: isochorismatase family cysteine hydrolase [Clostridium sp.]|uniref:isochorismatase family cysteine hydrolase n=1 Tax=Clostridium sp. TaxID=1506 RepID=UPI002FCC4F66
MLDALNGIKNELSNLKSVSISELPSNKTGIIVIDMVRGFYDVGPLASPRVEKIINPLVELNEKTKEYKKVFFIDCHKENSTEFKSYPTHCIEGTIESELINELKEYATNGTIVMKNSTNGFYAKEFQKWIKENSHLENFIVTGVCTDICVEAFVISLITYFNENNQWKNIIVPINLVETFDLGNHDAELMNLISLYKMKSNGIKIVKSIE